jgi:hypothetical protein
METLLDGLTTAGWRLVDPPEPFVLEDEQVLWVLVRGDTESRVELVFHAFGDLGQRTERLQNILYCVERGTDRKLYFDKQKSPEWKDNLASFVAHVGGEDPSRTPRCSTNSARVRR